MMFNVYDNWGRLVGAVIRREQLWKMFHDQSPSTSSASSDISSSSYHQRALQGDNNSQIKEESAIERLPYLVCFDGLDPAFDPSPEDSRNRKTAIDSTQESPSEQLLKSSIEISRKSGEPLKDGYIIALHARDRPAIHVSKQRVKGGGWFLDTMSNVTRRDPAAQFLVVFRNKDTIGLRSFTAGGKLLQINRRMEFFFASHSFDVWESWTFEGSLEECRLVNCRNPLAVLEVRVEIVAAVDEDGITRWLD